MQREKGAKKKEEREKINKKLPPRLNHQ